MIMGFKKVFHVTVVKYAWIYCEAETPAEAMKVAEKWKDQVDDDDFDDDIIGVDNCDTYATDLEDIDKDEVIYTAKEAMDYDDYVEKVNGPKDWRDDIEWTETEWLFPKEEMVK